MVVKQTKFTRFFVRFCVLYLGFLAFCFIFAGAISMRARLEFGNPMYWTYGYQLIAIVLLLYAVSIPSWIFALIKTWKLGAVEHSDFTKRLIVSAYLILAPVFLILTAGFWLKAARFVTDPLLF